jgi:predicted Na+-dependent transporter
MTYIVIASLITLTFILTFGLILPLMPEDSKCVFGVFLFLWIFAHIFFQIGAYWQRDDFEQRSAIHAKPTQP